MRNLITSGNNKGQITVGSILTIFITVLVGVALFQPITQSVADANATGTDATILNLVTLLYALLILAVIAVEVAVAFRRAR